MHVARSVIQETHRNSVKSLIGGPAPADVDGLSVGVPAPLTRFVGREHEVQELSRLLGETRLLTLTGAGGVGKTRLAFEVAVRARKQFADDVCVVELATTRESAFIPHTFSQALGLQGRADRVEQLVRAVGDRHLLLVVDNCEHLIEASAALIETLLRGNPQLAVLATSRQPLGVAGETTWRVPSLSFPWPAEPTAYEHMGQYEAVRLFLDRAAQAEPQFKLTARNVAAVAEICYRLDGIPLALELAAARLRVLTAEQLAARLSDRFRLLASAQRGGLGRHQTLLASVEWSHELLSDNERTLFRRLAGFANGWTLEFAERVCSLDGVARADVLDLLARLVEKSLVHVERRASATRYRLLETLRLYALARLEESGEGDAVRSRLADSFLDLAEEVAPALHGPDQSAWLSRLEEEHDNLRAAMDAATATGEHQVALRLALALWWFWLMHGYLDEGRRRLHRALAANSGASVASRAEAHYALGRLTVLSGSTAEASAEYEIGLQLAVEAGDAGLTARLLGGQARIQELAGDPERARQLAQASLAHAHAIGDVGQVADALNTLGNAASRDDAIDEADHAYRESLALFRQLGDRGRCASVVGNLGRVSLLRGAFVEADHLFEESRVEARSLGDLMTCANALNNLGFSAYRQGDRRRAEQRYREALGILRQLGEWHTVGTVVANIAILASDAGQHQRAAQLFGAAQALLERAGQPYPPVDADVSGHSRAEHTTRRSLGENGFAHARSDGQALSTNQTIALALARNEPSERERAGPLAGLSPRERQIATLMAQGLTNRQMAERLIISERTADTHVQNILAKLGCASRRDVAALLTAGP